VAARPGTPVDLSLQIRNQEWTPLRVDVRIDSTLPPRYSLQYDGAVPLRRTFIARGEPRNTGWQLAVPKRRPELLEPPYDGRVAGRASGGIAGFIDAQLSDARVLREQRWWLWGAPPVQLGGRLAGKIEQEADEVTIIGRFIGDVDLRTAHVTGRFTGTATGRDGRTWPGIELDVDGCLQPLRAIHLAQLVGGEPVDGVTLHLRTPRLRGQCDPEDWR
jgi:hypothetical protein